MFGQSPAGQTPALAPVRSARVAAVQFAIARGWQFPKTNIVVAMDTHLGAVDGHPIIPLDAERTRDTNEIAKLIGPDVKTGWAAQRLRCVGRGYPCYAKDVSVLVVGGLFVGENDIGIQVYSPGAKPEDPTTMTHAVIALEHRDTGWVGVSYSPGFEPRTLVQKRRF